MNARFLLLVLTLAVPSWATTAVPSESEELAAVTGYKAREVLVRFKPECSESDRVAVRAEMNGSLIRRFDRLRVEHIHLLGDGVDTTLQKFSSHRMIEYVEPNYALHAAVAPNDSLFSGRRLHR